MKSIVGHGVAALVLFAGGAWGQCEASKKACGSEAEAVVISASYRDTKDIVDTAVAAGQFKTLAAALKAAGLVDALKGKGPFTVFAPTDDAFAKLGTETLNSLLKPENKAKLAAILKYHVTAGNVTAADVSKLTSAETIGGQRVDVKVKDGKVMIDGATVTTADVKASNGVIHIIDTVILPSEKNVVETAVAAGTFKTLAELLTVADLAKTLSGDGPFTVFAPTDEAFAKLPAGTIDALKKDKAQLTKVLTYHVVRGRVFSDAAVKAGKAKTLQGQDAVIAVKEGKAMVDGANIVKTDLDASNGVIHVIDTVIMPK